MIARGVDAVIQQRPRLIPGEGLVLIYAARHKAEAEHPCKYAKGEDEPEQRAARARIVEEYIQLFIQRSVHAILHTGNMFENQVHYTPTPCIFQWRAHLRGNFYIFAIEVSARA